MSVKGFLLCAVIAISMIGCKPSDSTFEVSGSVVGDTTGVVVLIQEGQSRFDALTSPITEGKFHIAGIPLTSPEVFSLIVERPGQMMWDPSPVFISPGDNVEVALDSENPDKSVIRGASLNDEFSQYRSSVESYREDELDALREAFDKARAVNDTIAIDEINGRGRALSAEISEARLGKVYEYVEANPASFVSAYALYDNRHSLSTEQIEELTGMLDESVQGSKYVYGVVSGDRNQPGQPADDFTLKDSQNKEVVFSAFAEGKVVLLEFWASWCVPCRAANPKLEELYGKYKDRGFEILGISADRDVQTLRQSIEKDGLTFTNLMDVSGVNSVGYIYNMQMVPTSVLIDRNGMVVARDLNLTQLEDEILKLLQ